MASGAHPEIWQSLIDQSNGRGLEAGGVPGPEGDAAGMSLASANGGRGPGSAEASEGPGSNARLQQSAGPWTGAAGVAEALETSMGKAKDGLGTSHQGVSSEGGGLTSISELGAVRHSWERRLEDARKECAGLDRKLRLVAKDHGGKGAVLRRIAVLTVISDERRGNFLGVVERYWKNRGYEVTSVNKDKKLPAIYVETPKGFSLSLSFGYKGQAFFEAASPCADESEVAPPKANGNGTDYSGEKPPLPNQHSDFWSARTPVP